MGGVDYCGIRWDNSHVGVSAIVAFGGVVLLSEEHKS